MKRIRMSGTSSLRLLVVVCLIAIIASIDLALASKEPGIGGFYTELQVDVTELQKDGKLIGLSRSAIVEQVKEYLRHKKFRVLDDNKLPAVVVKVTTLDIGPQVASHITVSLKEPAKVLRSKSAVFVTSWQQSKMIASEPMKHEFMVKKAVAELLDGFVQQGLE